MKEKILLIGGGGHCASVLDSLLTNTTYSEIGIVDSTCDIGKHILGFPVIGCDDDLENLYAKGYHHAFVSLGSVGFPQKRISLFKKLREIGYFIPSIFDPSATISPNSSIEDGVFVGKNAVININARIKKGAIINSGAIVEHDCEVEEFTHIAPGCILCGGVQVGSKTHIGAGSIVRQNLRIGSNSMIGIGSIVLHDFGDNVTAYGNPCKDRML